MEDSGLSITFKYGKGYEEPWAVFKGGPTRVRSDLLAFFDIPAEVAAGKSLNELLIMCNHIVHGTGNVAAILGGVPISESQGVANVQAQLGGTVIETQGDPWATVNSEAGGADAPTAAPAENPHAGLLSQIAASTTKDELKRLWAANKSAFDNAEVKAAWSAKGKSL